MIKDNLAAILTNIHGAALRARRESNDVILVGVTKFADVPAINEAIHAGLTNIAENKVQQAEEKFSKLDLGGKIVKKHMIGHLQSNKVNDVLKLFDLIHSVDSVKLADEIQKRAAAIGKTAEILVQVDIAEEETKFGLPEDELDGMIAHLAKCPNIRTVGLMTMAPLTDDTAAIREIFRSCREILEHVKKAYPSHERIQMKHLSMGMSSDYEIAVEEGATMVRVGTAIFK